MHRAGVDIRPEAMGVTWDDVAEAVRTLPAYVREAGLWFSVVDAVPADRRPRRSGASRHRGRLRHVGRWLMRVGLTLPQGCDREYLGLDAATAWQRTIEVAQRAEEAGFDSLWAYDHFQVDPPPEEAIVFDPMVELAALAMATSRALLGTLVAAAAYRNAAMTAKMFSTIDVISGGRVVLGIGAGWKEDEWLAYGYGFPPASTRLAILGDHLEIITRMLAPGRATYAGAHAHVDRRDPRTEGAAAAAHPGDGRRQRARGHLAPRRPLRRQAQPRRACRRRPSPRRCR